MSYIFNTFFYNPLYNGLVFIIDLLPNGDAGVAVVLLTIIVSLLLFSISKKAIRTQIKLREIDPELREIKNKTTDKQEQARLMLALYQKHQVNPFSMILLMIIQIPILIALYYVFLRGGLPEIHTELLYSFIEVPKLVNMNFLGILDIKEKSLIIAILAGITQFIQAMIAIPKTSKPQNNNLSENFAHSMQVQMKFVFPVIIVFIGMGFPSALPLYWTTRNIFTIFQEIIVKKGLSKKN